MRNFRGKAIGGVALILASVSPLAAAPQADLISTAWQLDFNFQDVQRITLTPPGESAPVTYWYLLFQVVNNTGRDVEFYPSFDLVTDTLQVVKGGDNVGPAVYDAIALRHRSEYPFFAPPSKITGPLLQGEANSRASAAIFRPFDPLAASFTVYVAGLSGEVTRVSPPVKRPAPQGMDDAAFVLRRTLAIAYDLPGDIATRPYATPARRSRQWVMR